MVPPLFAAVFLAAATVKQDGAVLRLGGCDIDAPREATLAAGTPLEVRSSIAGSTGICYRVTATVNGKAVTGNLPADAIEGIEDFDRARQLASSGDGVQMMTAQVDGLRKALAARLPSGSLFQQAATLIERNEPVRALELLPATSNNPDILLLAGIAAWKADRVRLALEHWRNAQAIRPSEQVAAMIARLERELQHDRSGERATGLRVTLRYEGQSVPYATARGIVDAIDSEMSRLGTALGCAFPEKLTAIVQSPDAYRQGSNAAEWSGGQFDGRIRLPFAPNATLDPQLRKTLAHEVTHACLFNLGSYPSWLHEGLAQKLSGQEMGAGMRQSLREMAARKELPRLENMGRDWSGLSTRHARIAYALALAAADELPAEGLQQILRDPDRLARITKDLNQRLGIID